LLEEVLQKKVFFGTTILWIMMAVCGGRVAVTWNGEIGQCFKSFNGFRQGDPPSTLLLNLWIISLVVDLVERGLTQSTIRG